MFVEDIFISRHYYNVSLILNGPFYILNAFNTEKNVMKNHLISIYDAETLYLVYYG